MFFRFLRWLLDLDLDPRPKLVPVRVRVMTAGDLYRLLRARKRAS